MTSNSFIVGTVSETYVKERETLAHAAPLVLHIAAFLRGGGAEAFVRELVPSLVRRGIDARVLCGYGATRLTGDELKEWNGRVLCIEREGVPRFSYLNHMRRVIRQLKPTIVHTHGHVGATWGRAAAVLEKVPHLVHTEHISKPRLTASESIAHWFLNPQTDVTIMLSERTAQIVMLREKVREVLFIPNGIRIRQAPTESGRLAARQKLGAGDGQVVFGMIANLEAHKNPALAIDAFSLLPAETKAIAQLGLFGDGTLRQALSERVRALGLEDVVRFYGFRTDLASLLPGLDVVVSMSAREMMPMSLLEAMNAALPIIGPPHAGILDLVADGETGIILTSWSECELAQAIRWAIQDAAWRRRAGNAAYRRLVENFDLEVVADRYSELYRRLTS